MLVLIDDTAIKSEMILGLCNSVEQNIRKKGVAEDVLCKTSVRENLLGMSKACSKM